MYGTTAGGAENDGGSIYQLTLGGTATLEAGFTGATGWGPVGALVQGSDGRLYVTAQNNGGSNSSGVQDDGSIAVLDLGLPLPKPAIARFSPTSAVVGKEVIISQGPYIGATAVKFNGTSATFKVKGSGFIVATVPAGATTGPISVTTPAGMTVSRRVSRSCPTDRGYACAFGSLATFRNRCGGGVAFTMKYVSAPTTPELYGFCGSGLRFRSDVP